MPPVGHQEGSLQQREDLIAEPAAELNQLALVETGGAEAPLDVGLVVVGLGLGDPSQAVGVHGQEPQRRVVAASGTSEQLRDIEHGGVVLTGPVAWLWGGEAERL